MGKIHLFGRVLVAPAIASWALLSAPTVWAATMITVGKADANSTAFLPVHLGERLGFFKQHGVELKISNFTGGSKMTQAVTAGSIDIGLGAGTEMALIAKGAPMLAVCDIMSPIPIIGIAVPWDSPIHTLDQLKGKRIGISSAGSLTDWLAKQLAHHQSWGPDDLKAVAIGNGAAATIAAFRTNAIDADIAVTSNIFNWEEKKEGRLLVSATSFVGNIASGTIYATKHLIAEDPGALRGFLAAWMETIGYLVAHKAETVKIESEVTGYSEGVMTKEYDLTATKFNKDCRFDAESLANLKRAFIDQKLVETAPDMSTLYTEAFLPKR
ncbi:MAG TPA: ABC transporter substrate-binding protein [Stellaceae bacterium]|nr:ABC transporter substrate-binding protein [Stellaceae bacterium]